jgi:hypothetical protein
VRLYPDQLAVIDRAVVAMIDEWAVVAAGATVVHVGAGGPRAHPRHHAQHQHEGYLAGQLYERFLQTDEEPDWRALLEYNRQDVVGVRAIDTAARSAWTSMLLDGCDQSPGAALVALQRGGAASGPVASPVDSRQVSERKP